MDAIHRAHRRSFLFGVVWAVFASAAPGQTSDLRGHTADRMRELQNLLKLTPDQAERARPVFQREAQRIGEILQNFDRNSASMRQKRQMARDVRSIRNEADQQLKTILSSDQMKELQRFREEFREKLRDSSRSGA